MSQDTHIIDLRRPYIPADPNSFAATYHDTQNEDNPEPRIPVVPYDMANCMPTAQGYASYFGLNSSLGIDTLVESGGSGNVDDMFLVLTNDFRNILVALCDDGVWTKAGATVGAWTQEIVLTPPTTGQHKNWSKCVLENTLFVYRQAEAHLWRCRDDESYVFTETDVTTLTMAGQLGIFKAGGRLGFWDSENSTAWSDLGAPVVANVISFAPSQQSLAGASIFQDIVGRIVNVLQHGTGFVIYATKSIVHVQRNPSNPSLFAGRAIFNNNGISYRGECCYGEPDTTHYAITTQGFVVIENGQAKFEIPDVITYLKEKRQPIYLKILNGRYLFFPYIDPYYSNGLAKFSTTSFGPISISFRGASYAIENIEENVCRAFNAGMIQHEGKYLYENYGYTDKTQATTPGEVPVWEDNLDTIVVPALLEAWKASGVTGNGSYTYFEDKFTSQGGIAKITSGTEYFIPTGMVTIASYAFQANLQTEANEQNFWMKQDFLWHYEGNMFADWKEAIKRHVYEVSANVELVDPSEIAPPVRTDHEFGPYIDLSFFSEANKYYGTAEKSAWSQRSLTGGVLVTIPEVVTVEAGGDFYEPEVYEFKHSTNPAMLTGSGLIEPNQIGLAASTFLSGINISNPGGAPHSGAFVATENSADYWYETFHNNGTTITGLLQFTITATPIEGSLSYDVPAGIPGLATEEQAIKTQRFGQPKFTQVEFPTCTYKELGFTKITGHGHYNLLGEFSQDNTTDEDEDYIDACDDEPNKRKKARFNGILVPGSASEGGFLCGTQEVTINSIAYTYPDEVVTLPSGTNFLQDGSIEPIYPTYLGAFVYDTHYKKWGKMVQPFKHLLDYFPINDSAGDAPIPYDTFLPKGSLLSPDGEIYLFDQFPFDSFITFGKYGQYRKGFTDVEEVAIQHRTPMSGTVTVDGSLDGRVLEIGLSKTFTYEAVTKASSGMGLSARWYNVTVEGNYDLTNLELRSSRKGKR